MNERVTGARRDSRTWPFEGRPEPQEPFHSPRDFVVRRGPDVRGAVVRIGLHDAQLVLVDATGLWDRWVYVSVDAARAAAAEVGVEAGVGRFADDVRVDMNRRRRTPEEFASGAYPEQGRVGPVVPYPENRPRRPAADEEHTG
jgi:hypothetical protein